MINKWNVIIILASFFSCKNQQIVDRYDHYQKATVLYDINFDQKKDLELFHIETEVNDEEITIKNGALDIDAIKGATIWFKEKLSAPTTIEYTVSVLDQGGENDRVSDLNCFFMAIDPRCPSDIFSCEDSIRTGRFADYHVLRTYYVGFGGNNNTTTRMRRYPGATRERPMLKEHDLNTPLIVANKKIKVKINVKSNIITYAHEGKDIFHMNDKLPYHEGWFGFRTINNHMQIHNFKIIGVSK